MKNRSGAPRPVALTAEPTVTVAENHLNDLQAEVEAGSRQLGQLGEELLAEQLRQAETAGRLASHLAELRTSVATQRERLRERRHEIRRVRQFVQRGRTSRG